MLVHSLHGQSCTVPPLQALNEDCEDIVKCSKVNCEDNPPDQQLNPNVYKVMGYTCCCRDDANLLTYLKSAAEILVSNPTITTAGGTFAGKKVYENHEVLYEFTRGVKEVVVKIFEKVNVQKTAAKTAAKAGFALSLVFEGVFYIHDIYLAYAQMQQDISSAQEEGDFERVKHAKDEFKETLATRTTSVVGAVGGATAGAFVGSLFFPGVGTWVGGIVGHYVGSRVGGTLGGAMFESDK